MSVIVRIPRNAYFTSLLQDLIRALKRRIWRILIARICALIFIFEFVINSHSTYHTAICRLGLRVTVAYLSSKYWPLQGLRSFINYMLTSSSSVGHGLAYLDGEPFAPLLLGAVLVPRTAIANIGSVAHSPFVVPQLGMDSPWKSAYCLKIWKCARLGAVWAPLSRFMEGAPYKFSNELMN